MNILALNAGSSSLKFRLGPPEGPARFTGEAQGFGHTPAFDIRDASGAKVTEAAPPTLADAAKAVLDFAGRQAKPDAIGHRFVHGGPGLLSHRRIDVEVRTALIAASQFAPLHNPPALEVLALSDAVFPGLPQVACLDTAFHADMPLLAQRLPLPANRLPPGLRRYGFHGLSCESILEQFDTVPPRLVIAHLGGG
ncbi:MAG TPA: hypothetical protein VG501_00825, partial [Rhizomicrobium sp.]|nr:hypothetical protein [Rhizomicrobium sp.]